MADKGCRSEDCEAHMYMVETMRELKDMDRRLLDNQQALERASIKLTENFLELQRTNTRLDQLFTEQKEKDDQQDKLIADQGAFMNKAIGVLSTLTFLVPICLFVLGLILKG